MTWCYKITDVSALGNVYELIISGCDNITDINALENVHLVKNLWFCCQK